MQFIIKSPKDVDELEKRILKDGFLSQSAYQEFLRQANRSEFAARIRNRLERKIKPLVGLCFTKKYKASDFIVSKGKISLGKLQLKSVSIDGASSSILNRISNEFSIAPDPTNCERFVFNPMSDLSIFLNKIKELKLKDKQEKAEKEKERKKIIKEQKQIELEKIKQKEYSHFIKIMPKLVNDYIVYSYEKLYGYGYSTTLYYHKKIELLKLAKLIPQDTETSEFLSQMPYLNLQVPLEDIEIFDGYIIIRTQNVKTVNGSWTEFYNINYRCFKQDIKTVEKKHIKQKFEELLSTYTEQISQTYPSIYVNSFLSKKSFIEAFIQKREKQRMGLNNKKLQIELPDFTSYNLNPEYGVQPTSFRFPSCFLNNDKNNGVALLTSIPNFLLYDVVTSEYFEFASKDIQIIEEIISEFPADLKATEFTQELVFGLCNMRIITSFYYDRFDSMYLSAEDHETFRIIENHHHYSDEIDYGWGDGKTTEYGTSYIQINEERHTISLYPADRQYSSYRFFVDDEISSLKIPAYAIMVYFTSSICNKRQRINKMDEFKYFGIYNITRY